MLNIFKQAKKDGTGITMSYSLETTMAEYADRKIHMQAINGITDRLVNDWIEAYGADLLKKITPEEVEKAVKQNLAKRVLGE